MAVNRKIAESLARLTLEQREIDFHHHSYDEDLKQYEYMKHGDQRALSEGVRMFEGPNTGSLSDDPVVNYKYLFVSSITLACRFCIEGGMQHELAFNLSDLYIRQADRCKSVDEIFALHNTMFRDYTMRMRELLRGEVYSRQVHQVMDYIDQNLHKSLTVELLSAEVGITPSYLSTLFKKETGLAVSECVRRKRIEAAKMLLQYTEFNCLEIAEYLCFSSDSHLSRMFKDYTGLSPSEFRKRNYRKHWSETP